MTEKINIKVQSQKLFGLDLVYYKTFASTFIVAGLFVFSSLIVLYPKLSQVGDYRTEIDQITTQLSGLESKSKYLAAVDQSKLSANEFIFSQALPDVKDLYFLLNVVSEISKQHNFGVESFSVAPGDVISQVAAKPAGGKSNVNRVPLSVVLIGPRENYLELIKTVEKALPIMSIDRFTLLTAEASNVTLNMTISTHTYVPPAASTKEAPLSELQLSKKELELVDTLTSYKKLEIQSVSASQSATIGQPGTGRADPFNL